MRCFEKFENYSIDWKKSFPDNPDTNIACGAVLSRFVSPEKGLEAAQKALEIDSSYHYKFAQVLSLQEKKG